MKPWYAPPRQVAGAVKGSGCKGGRLNRNAGGRHGWGTSATPAAVLRHATVEVLRKNVYRPGPVNRQPLPAGAGIQQGTEETEDVQRKQPYI